MQDVCILMTSLQAIMNQKEIRIVMSGATGQFFTDHGDHATGSDAVARAHPHQALVVRILAPLHQHLLAHEVGLLIDHEETALNSAGVTPAQVGGELRAVIAGLIGTTLEVPFLIEDDLREGKKRPDMFVYMKSSEINSQFHCKSI